MSPALAAIAHAAIESAFREAMTQEFHALVLTLADAKDGPDRVVADERFRAGVAIAVDAYERATAAVDDAAKA